MVKCENCLVQLLLQCESAGQSLARVLPVVLVPDVPTEMVKPRMLQSFSGWHRPDALPLWIT